MAYSARGLRLLKAIETISNIKPNIFDVAVFNKIKLSSISNGVIRGSFVIEPGMCNLAGFLHGGYMSSVIDVMTYYAQMSCPDGRTALTMSMSVNFIAPAKIGENMIVETYPLRSGQTAVIETNLKSEDGKLVAKAINSFMALEKYRQGMKDVTNFDTHEA